MSNKTTVGLYLSFLGPAYWVSNVAADDAVIWVDPFICNEDAKLGAQAAKAAELCVTNGTSWGLMLERTNQHFPFTFNGSADDAVVYAKLKELTSP